ncbi:MAG: hypothetical protein KDE63_11725, partial [Novosphingobium sp.]|nr:hypothetical protein [Novosphingobium sp.]
MNAVTTLGALRKAAYDARPGRLQRIADYSFSLSEAGVDYPDALKAIEDALWSDGLLPVDRASQRRAWEKARERAVVAYEDGLKSTARRVVKEHY